jgi:hypothetical protein
MISEEKLSWGDANFSREGYFMVRPRGGRTRARKPKRPYQCFETETA